MFRSRTCPGFVRLSPWRLIETDRRQLVALDAGASGHSKSPEGHCARKRPKEFASLASPVGLPFSVLLANNDIGIDIGTTTTATTTTNNNNSRRRPS